MEKKLNIFGYLLILTGIILGVIYLIYSHMDPTTETSDSISLDTTKDIATKYNITPETVYKCTFECGMSDPSKSRCLEDCIIRNYFDGNLNTVIQQTESYENSKENFDQNLVELQLIPTENMARLKDLCDKINETPVETCIQNPTSPEQQRINMLYWIKQPLYKTLVTKLQYVDAAAIILQFLITDPRVKNKLKIKLITSDYGKFIHFYELQDDVNFKQFTVSDFYKTKIQPNILNKVGLIDVSEDLPDKILKKIPFSKKDCIKNLYKKLKINSSKEDILRLLNEGIDASSNGGISGNNLDLTSDELDCLIKLKNILQTYLPEKQPVEILNKIEIPEFKAISETTYIFLMDFVENRDLYLTNSSLDIPLEFFVKAMFIRFSLNSNYPKFECN